MGLDMWLYRKQHFGKYGRHSDDKMKVIVKGDGGEKSFDIADGGVNIETQVAYWRKANQIHNWFMEKDENGEGGHVVVDITDLQELLQTVKEVLAKIEYTNGIEKVASGHMNKKENDTVWLLTDNREAISRKGKFSELAEGVAFILDEVKPHEVGDLVHEYSVVDEVVWRRDGEMGIRYNAYEYSNTVIANPEVAEELLPTIEGFFFGNTEYGEGYVEDLENTQKMLEKIIADHEALIAEGANEYDIDYIYEASW